MRFSLLGAGRYLEFEFHRMAVPGRHHSNEGAVYK
jgi:hypothetical protein